jgi:hypothetical protein
MSILNIETKENSPEKLAAVAGKDTKFFLMAEEFNDVVEAINDNDDKIGDLEGDLAGKEDKINKGIANGYAPLNGFIKLASEYLDIVNNLVTGGSTALLSAQQGVILKSQIDAIYTLLASDNVDLDNVQELVDAIESLQVSLNTILVNDLTTGGITKALTAEMGKSLKTLVDSLATNKLEKGAYTGTAQDLKNSIDAIYQPDVVIRYTPPTRVGDTFTFPNAGYDVLLSKVLHTNTSQLVTTIAVATTDYKRTDLIYYKSDDTIVKIQGAESTTVAIRPDVPAGGIGLYFINVFGATVSTPTPIDKTISVQDSFGVEKFKISDYVRFKGVAFNASTKQIEVNPLTARRIFLSNSGNDSTAEVQDSTKPYKTLNAIVMWMLSQSHKGFEWYIETLDNGIFTYTIDMMTLGVSLRGFNIINNSGAIIYIENNWTITDQNIFLFTSGELIYKFTDATTPRPTNRTLSVTPVAVFRHDVLNVTFTSTRTTNVNLDRGLWESFCSNVNTNYINWGTLRVNDKSFRWTDNYPTNVKIKINVVNNYETTNSGKNLFSSYISPCVNVEIGTYNNLTSINHVLSSLNVTIGNINSANAITQLLYQNLILNSSASFTNVSLGQSTNLVARPILNGNNNTLTLNNTTAIPILANVGGNAFKNSEARSLTNELVIMNVNIVIPSGSLSTCFTSYDYRLSGGGSWGGQIVFDNVNLLIQNSKPILLLANFENFNAGYQLIFKNSVNIYSNNYILSNNSGYYPVPIDTTINKNFLVQELASVYHDYGKIHAKGIFPPISQYNTYNNIKKSEIRITTKDQIINTSVRSDYTYIIDGAITLLTGEYIDIPTGGATIIGYGFDVSKIIKNVAGQSIFRSVTGGMGNLILKDVSVNSGVGSVFALTDSDGSHALEFNDVNFENCASLGSFTGFRQFTATTCGFYSCSDGFTLEGTWSGFKITNSNVIGFGASGTFIKKGTSTSFANRLYLDLNMSIATGSKICDFQDSNFASNKLLQVVNCLVKVNGVIDPTTTSATFPNISPFSAKSYFTNNIGVKNSFNEPYGLKTTNLATYANDTDAAAGNVQVGEVYIETATGYFKTRLV